MWLINFLIVAHVLWRLHKAEKLPLGTKTLGCSAAVLDLYSLQQLHIKLCLLEKKKSSSYLIRINVVLRHLLNTTKYWGGAVIFCHFWVTLVVRVSVSVFPFLFSPSGLSDVAAVSMSSPLCFWTGVSILSSGCAPQHTPYPGTTPGAGLDRHFWEFISNWGAALSEWLCASAALASLCMQVRQGCSSVNPGKIDRVSSWCCMHLTLLPWASSRHSDRLTCTWNKRKLLSIPFLSPSLT